MSRELDKFLNVHIPGKGYHAHNREIELFSEKNLAFPCGCGTSHPVNNSVAIIDFPIENKGVYVCPNNDGIFTLVKATGILSVKGLKTIAFYKATNEVEQQEIMLSLESRKNVAKLSVKKPNKRIQGTFKPVAAFAKNPQKPRQL